VTAKLAGSKYTINGEIGGTGTRVLFKTCYNLEAIANSGRYTLEIEKQLLLFENTHRY
jgi:polysaccharide export outer membrane protein